MDVHMPGWDGYETTKRLRAIGFTRPVIAVTAAAFKEDTDHCMEAGMNDVLLKPFRKVALLDMLSKYTPYAGSSVASENSDYGGSMHVEFEEDKGGGSSHSPGSFTRSLTASRETTPATSTRRLNRLKVDALRHIRVAENKDHGGEGCSADSPHVKEPAFVANDGEVHMDTDDLFVKGESFTVQPSAGNPEEEPGC